MRSRSTAADWLAGLVVGAAGGFLFAVWPTLGLLLVLGFGTASAVSRGRVAAFGGLLTGTAATWLAVALLADARCRAFDAQPGSECVGPDVTGWFVLSGAVLIVGVLLTVGAARRASGRGGQ